MRVPYNKWWFYNIYTILNETKNILASSHTHASPPNVCTIFSIFVMCIQELRGKCDEKIENFMCAARHYIQCFFLHSCGPLNFETKAIYDWLVAWLSLHFIGLIPFIIHFVKLICIDFNKRPKFRISSFDNVVCELCANPQLLKLNRDLC